MPEQNNTQNPTGTTNPQLGAASPISSQNASIVPVSNPTENIKPNTDGDKPKWTDKTVALFTLFLFMAAIIQGVIFYKQWQEMHSGGTDTHDLAIAAKAQAEASKVQVEEATAQVEKLAESLKKTDSLILEATAQANAASRQASGTNALAVQAQRSADYAQQAIRASVEAERPWIGVAAFNVSNFEEGKTAKISINIINSGKRPAKASAYYTTILTNSLPTFPNIYVRQPSVAFILPGGTFGTTFDYDVPNNAFAEWKRTKQIFFVVMEVVYTDVGTNTAYITHYCSYYDPSNKNQPFPLCTRYNEAK